MPRYLKAVVIANEDDKKKFLKDFLTSQAGGLGLASIEQGFTKRQLDAIDCSLRVYRAPNHATSPNYDQALNELITDAHIGLYPVYLEASDAINMDDTVKNWTGHFRGNKEWIGERFPVFMVFCAPELLGSLQEKFAAQASDLAILICEAKAEPIGALLEKTLIAAIKEKQLKPTELPDPLTTQKDELKLVPHAIPTVSSKSLPKLIDQLTGAFVSILLGTVTAVFVYNPIASLFAGVSNFWKHPTINSLLLMLASPIWGPLKGIFYKAMYEGASKGWDNGFFKSFSTAKAIFKHACLTEKTPISIRNIIASLIIMGLMITLVLGIIFTPLSLAAFLPTVMASMQLTGWSTAILAGMATLLGASILYGILAKTYDLMTKPYGSYEIIDDTVEIKASLANLDKPNKLSKTMGAIIGAVLGALTSAVIFNPVASLYSSFRWYWRNLPWQEKLGFAIPLLLFPIVIPLIAIIGYGIVGQGSRGWEKGFVASFNAGDDIANNRLIPSDKVIVEYSLINSLIVKKDFIASLLLIGFVAAVVLIVAVPPFSLFLGIPALAATLGLGGLSMPLLALISGVAAFITGSMVHGIVSLCTERPIISLVGEEVNVKPYASEVTNNPLAIHQDNNVGEVAACLNGLPFIANWWKGKHAAKAGSTDSAVNNVTRIQSQGYTYGLPAPATLKS